MGQACDCLPTEKDALIKSIGKSDPKYHPKQIRKKKQVFSKGGQLWQATNEINGERMALAILPYSDEMYYLDDKQELIQQVKHINSNHFIKVLYQCYDDQERNYYIFFEDFSHTLNQSIQKCLKNGRVWTERKLIKVMAAVLRCLEDYEIHGCYCGLVKFYINKKDNPTSHSDDQK